MALTKEAVANAIGEFGWSFGKEFFVETNLGNFVWSDPDYQGDNTMTLFNGNLRKFCKSRGIPYVRDKGKHIIKSYCGEDFTLVIPQ